jgi:hypothetical protein
MALGARTPPSVPGVPPAALADGRVTAKAWLLALVEAAPLDAAALVPAGRVAQEGPALCAAVLEAVGADAALVRLCPDGDRHDIAAGAGTLAGARSAAPAVTAVGLLRSATWTLLTGELAPLDAAATAALAERLAHVTDVVAAAAAEPAAAAAPTRRLAAVPAVGERPWVRAAARLAARPGESPAAFALLALEAEDAERLLAADPDGTGAALTRLQDAIRDALPSAHTLIPERPWRMWVLAPGAHRREARTLGERLAAAALGDGAEPLAVRVGVAACPEDGTDPRALADQAQEGVVAARAAGRRLG